MELVFFAGVFLLGAGALIGAIAYAYDTYMGWRDEWRAEHSSESRG